MDNFGNLPKNKELVSGGAVIWKELDWLQSFTALLLYLPLLIPAAKFPSRDLEGTSSLAKKKLQWKVELMLDVLGYHFPNSILQNSILKDIN